MQRYDFDELTKHECDDGEWVRASEAEAEIARLRKALASINHYAKAHSDMYLSDIAEDALENGE